MGLIVPEWEAVDTPEPEAADDDNPSEADIAEPEVPSEIVEARLQQLPPITLRFDMVPAELDPSRFIGLLATKLMRNSPINFHREARLRRQEALGDARPLNRGL